MSKKIVISGYFGFDNLGDEAILSSMVQSLSNFCDKSNITVLSSNPAKTMKEYGVNAISRTNILKIKKEINDTDLVISGGGGLLQDSTGPFTIPYYLGIVYLAKRAGKPVMFYAQGIGPVRGKIGKFLIKFIGNKVDVITVRDEASKEELRKLGIKTPKIYVTADPVFDLNSISEKRIEEILSLEGYKVDKEKVSIGVSIREWKDNVNFKEVLAKSLDFLIDEFNACVLFIPMHFPYDHNVSFQVMNLMKHEAFIIKGKYRPEELLGIISITDLLIAMRLHALIFGVMNRVPVVGISYDPKIESLLKSVGLKSAGNIENINMTDFLIHVNEIWKNREKTKEDLKRKTAALKEKAKRSFELVKEFFIEGVEKR